ncbi:phage filamentation protein Fil family protein [Pantoea sp.]|uniref:phage filamentation protein Fil family protein n=1 Tax=Pantoea sp. TaxID=69393 RepID=UPI0028A1ACE7|nr:phage filamentation protein Fil family protein [Pantoea sp.]
MAFSVAPLLKRQNPSPAYGHGWIMGANGRRWHPSNSQTELLAGLTGNGSKAKCLTKLKISLFR